MIRRVAKLGFAFGLFAHLLSLDSGVSHSEDSGRRLHPGRFRLEWLDQHESRSNLSARILVNSTDVTDPAMGTAAINIPICSRSCWDTRQ